MRLNKFMQAATKIILRIRADKRLARIMAIIGNAKSREEVQKLVSED
jgi:hypothetical protein